MKATNIILTDEDRKAIQVIRDRYGIASLSGAVRYALRELARRIEETKEQR